MKIGIGLTVHNRNETAEYTLEKIKELAPEGAKIVVVDDASRKPFKRANFRFDINVGIPIAKNKCLELLGDCDFYFLFEDDVFPKKKGWWMPYVTSGINHLSFTFDKLKNGRPNGNDLIKQEGDFNIYKNPCGCVLFFTKKTLETVGGFDVRYQKYGYEHVDLSTRIHNAGLTPYKFMDVKNSLELFTSLDYEGKVQSSVKNRKEYIEWNRAIFENSQKSKEFCPIIQEKKMAQKNVILTSYFNYTTDPQRGCVWEKDISNLIPIIQSCVDNKQHLYIFTNCLKDTINNKYIHFVDVIPSRTHSPNVYRWIVYEEWMNRNDFEKCWMVDSTDVVLLKDPFKIIAPGKIYVGDEVGMITDNDWMRKNQEKHLRIRDYRLIIRRHARGRLLNCGLVGGEKEVITQLINTWAGVHKKNTVGIKKSTDMAVFNYVLRKYFNEIIVHGESINTKFKGNETNNKVAIWKHK